MTCSVYDQFTLTLTSQWCSHEAFIYQPKVHHAHSCSYLSFSRNISVFLILFLSINGIFSQDMQQNWSECWKCLCCVMTKPSIWASLWTSLTSTNKSRESQAQVEGLEARQSEPDTLPFIPAWHSTWLGQTILSTCCKCLRHTQCRYHKWRNWVLTTTNVQYLLSRINLLKRHPHLPVSSSCSKQSSCFDPVLSDFTPEVCENFLLNLCHWLVSDCFL